MAYDDGAELGDLSAVGPVVGRQQLEGPASEGAVTPSSLQEIITLTRGCVDSIKHLRKFSKNV